MPVPFVGTLVVQSADDMHFRAAILSRFLTPRENLLITHRVPLGVPQITPKRAEPTTIDAHVSRIEVSVDVEVGDVAIHPFPHKIGELTDGLKGNFGIVEKDTVIQAQPLLGLNLVTNLSEAGITFSHVHDRRLCFRGKNGR